MSPPLRRLAVLGLVLAASVASCQEPTQITLTVRTNVPYRPNVSMAMWSSSGGRIPQGSAPQVTHGEPWLSDGLLGDLVVTPRGGKDEPLTLHVVLGVGRDPARCSSEDSKGCIVARRRLAFVPHTRLRVPVVLWLACDGVACGEDETCNYVGKCVPAALDPAACSSPDGCVLPGDPPGTGDAGISDAGPGDTRDASDSAGDAGVSVVQLATGWQHTCALLSSGVVKCWGENQYGELGDGTMAPRSTPTPVINLGGAATAIAAGAYHSCALVGGGVKCWGLNNFGQLGDNTATLRNAPVSVVNLGGAATALSSACAYHTCAVVDGVLKCWGYNFFGQLGDGTTAQRNTPVSVINLGGAATAIVGGLAHTCGLLSGGVIKCWGQNASGELGDGTTAPKSTPTPVINPGGAATAVTGGRIHTCALIGGAVKCWGSNDFGQLGDNSMTRRSAPVSVINLGGAATALSGGGFHNCALVGGGVRCWGSNGNNEMGDGTMTHRSTPVSVMNLGGAVMALSSAGAEHACALLNGSVRCWGRNTSGQLGDGTTTPRGTPVAVLSLP